MSITYTMHNEKTTVVIFLRCGNV